MSAPIPATLPNLLRPGTGVRHDRYGALVVVGPSSDGTGRYDCAAPDSGYSLYPDTLTLDLDNATTRAHLAWWILAQPGFDDLHPPRLGLTHTAVGAAFDAAMSGQAATEADIHALTTVARHLAGLENE